VNALELYRAGIAVIPCHPRSKRPRVRWHDYKPPDGRLPTPAEFRRWFPTGGVSPTTNAAAICGYENLAVLDFDTLDGYAAWLAWATAGAPGSPAHPDARRVASEGYRVRTGRGVHVYVLCDAPPAGGDLVVGGKRAGEVKGTGQCAMLPPSVHPSGAVYTAVDARAPIPRVAAIAGVVPEWTGGSAPAPRVPRPVPATPSVDQGLRRVGRMSDLWPESQVDAIKRRLTLLDLFPDATPSGGGGRWYMTRCPFHDDASPSLRLDLRAGVAACFAGCLGRRGADVIALWARLHGVDNRRAIRELAGVIGYDGDR
jgi:hypothetical protein